jgi:hypothetical protein
MYSCAAIGWMGNLPLPNQLINSALAGRAVELSRRRKRRATPRAEMNLLKTPFVGLFIGIYSFGWLYFGYSDSSTVASFLITLVSSLVAAFDRILNSKGKWAAVVLMGVLLPRIVFDIASHSPYIHRHVRRARAVCCLCTIVVAMGCGSSAICQRWYAQHA